MDLLKQLYSIHSYSRHEERMVSFLQDYIHTNIPTATVLRDSQNNLLITKGQSDTYPCLAAHTDQVQYSYPKHYQVIDVSDNTLHGYDSDRHQLVGLGADDKNGVWIALRALEQFPALKVAFFTAEEVGGQGSRAVDMSFFDNCRWVGQIDRKGSSDFISSYTDTLCSKQFIKDCKLRKWGFNRIDGTSYTDVATLKRRGLNISCFNISCGYYNPHSSDECTVIPELLHTRDFIFHLITDLTRTYRHTYKPSPVSKPASCTSYQTFPPQIHNLFLSRQSSPSLPSLSAPVPSASPGDTLSSPPVSQETYPSDTESEYESDTDLACKYIDEVLSNDPYTSFDQLADGISFSYPDADFDKLSDYYDEWQADFEDNMNYADRQYAKYCV